MTGLQIGHLRRVHQGVLKPKCNPPYVILFPLPLSVSGWEMISNCLLKIHNETHGNTEIWEMSLSTLRMADVQSLASLPPGRIERNGTVVPRNYVTEFVMECVISNISEVGSTYKIPSRFCDPGPAHTALTCTVLDSEMMARTLVAFEYAASILISSTKRYLRR